MLQRPEATEYADFYSGYIRMVPEGDIRIHLEEQKHRTSELLCRVPEEVGNRSYAEGKWSLKEVLGHMADVERIMAYRLLRFGRGDATPLAGFDESSYAAAGRFQDQSMEELVLDLGSVRQATLSLIGSLREKDWIRTGQANGAVVSVRALLYIIAGHELHHLAVLRERYLAR